MREEHVAYIIDIAKYNLFNLFLNIIYVFYKSFAFAMSFFSQSASLKSGTQSTICTRKLNE